MKAKISMRPRCRRKSIQMCCDDVGDTNANISYFNNKYVSMNVPKKEAANNIAAVRCHEGDPRDLDGSIKNRAGDRGPILPSSARPTPCSIELSQEKFFCG